MADHVVLGSDLRRYVAAIFEAEGVPVADASLVADTLVQADEWGHQSHGVLRTPWYVARLRSAVMRRTTAPEVTQLSDALALIDGHDGIGQVIAAAAIDLAVERAASTGIAAVGVRNSNHFGTAGYFTRRAAARGFIGILTTNASASMPPYGGSARGVGNNPWSIAAPAGRYGQVVMDISNTAVARGKIYLARQRDEAIPEGWALTADGRPTTDPTEAIAGLIMPMGGHKGYVISFMMDVLSGVLTGGKFGAAIAGPYVPDKVSGAGHFAMAIDIELMTGLAAFVENIEALIDEVKAVPALAGMEIYYPGELEDRHAIRAANDGVALPERTVADLLEIGEYHHLAPPPFERSAGSTPAI
jgi:LDH2 family malate/lactate/ureidoglycolate dehydrogenase